MKFFNFFSPKWKHSNSMIRIKAVRELKENDILSDIALNDTDPAVRQVAIDNIFCPSTLANIAQYAKHSDSRRAAIAKVNHEEILSEIAKNDSSEKIRKIAIQKIKKQSIISDIAISAKYTDSRYAAVKLLNDEEALEQIVENETSEKVRKKASGKLNDYKKNKKSNEIERIHTNIKKQKEQKRREYEQSGGPERWNEFHEELENKGYSYKPFIARAERALQRTKDQRHQYEQSNEGKLQKGLEWALQQWDVDTVRELVDLGASFTLKGPMSGWNCWHKMFIENQFPAEDDTIISILKIAFDSGVDIDMNTYFSDDEWGPKSTPLKAFIERHRPRVVRFLLERGADTRDMLSLAESQLKSEWVIHNNKIDEAQSIVDMLIEKETHGILEDNSNRKAYETTPGTSIIEDDLKEKTAMGLTSEEVKSAKLMVEFLSDVADSNYTKLEKIIRKGLNTTNALANILSFAYVDIIIVKLLFENGADVNALDKDCKTALLAAVQHDTALLNAIKLKIKDALTPKLISNDESKLHQKMIELGYSSDPESFKAEIEAEIFEYAKNRGYIPTVAPSDLMLPTTGPWNPK